MTSKTGRDGGAGTAGLLLATVVLVAMTLGCSVEPSAQQGQPASAASAALEYPMWETVAPGENASYNQRESLVRRGRLVYIKYCIGCHGEYGDGQGVAAKRLITKPRDFTRGIYKFRSTDSSSLPLETDLYRTIDRGLAQVSMPAFRLMPEGDKVAVIEYIKGFYPQWEERKGNRKRVPIPLAPADLATEERIQRGRVVYLATQCWKCHGTDGRGKRATLTEYTDAWGNPQKAFDFTRGQLKGGNAPEDIYRTFHTGLRSIMPSFGGDTLSRITLNGFERSLEALEAGEAELLQPYVAQFPADGMAVNEMSSSQRLSLAERNSWDLVAYIQSLRTSSSTRAAVLATSRTGG